SAGAEDDLTGFDRGVPSVAIDDHAGCATTSDDDSADEAVAFHREIGAPESVQEVAGAGVDAQAVDGVGRHGAEPGRALGVLVGLRGKAQLVCSRLEGGGGGVSEIRPPVAYRSSGARH